MKIISEIKIKVNGELRSAHVTDEGFVIMPDGTQKKLSEQQFNFILEKVKGIVLVDETAKPITLPENIQTPDKENNKNSLYETEVKDKMDIEDKTEKSGTDKNQHSEKGELNLKKESSSTKGKNKKRVSKGSTAVLILSVGILIMFASFFYAVMSGMVSFNAPYSNNLINPDSSTSNSPAPQATKDDLDEAQTILIVARIITPEGEKKEAILGYFTTDEESSSPTTNDNSDTSNKLTGESSVNQNNATIKSSKFDSISLEKQIN